jgi:hypothetical protein
MTNIIKQATSLLLLAATAASPANATLFGAPGIGEPTEMHGPQASVDGETGISGQTIDDGDISAGGTIGKNECNAANVGKRLKNSGVYGKNDKGQCTHAWTECASSGGKPPKYIWVVKKEPVDKKKCEDLEIISDTPLTDF